MAERGRKPALIQAVQDDIFNLLSSLIAAGADVNATDTNHKTALIYAVYSDNDDFVRALIAADADVNRTDNEGKTALFYAVQQCNNESVVRALIDAGADVNITDNEGKTALFYAVQNENESVVRTLIDAGADVNTTDNGRKTALFYAVQQRNNELSVVQALIDAGADLNKSDIYSKTALIHAVENNKEARAVALIKAGADVNKRDKWMKTPLIYAVLNGNKCLVRALIDEKADVNAADIKHKTALVYALYNGQETLIDILVKAGADVNRTDNEGKTALFYAVQLWNNESVVRALIDAGAEVNRTDSKWKTALFYAVQLWNNGSVVRALIDAGADVNITDNKGKTALYYAVRQKDNESVVRALIDAGADVNITDYEGKTALFYTVQLWNIESVVRALIDAGADVNRTDNEGKTALFYAVQLWHDESVVRALIDAGADVNRTDNVGKTALFYAVQSGNEIVVGALIDAGANVNTNDNELRTALFYAVQKRDNEKVVRKLIAAGADLNKSDIYSKTALIFAVENKREASAIALVKVGADVNKWDKWMRTPLIYAILNENECLVRALIDAKADVNATDMNLRTALIYAIQSEKDFFVQTLIRAGAHLDIIDIGRKTALIRAVESINKAAALALIKAGANVNKQDKWLRTALIHAVLTENEDLVRALIDAEVNVNATDKDQKSALIHAIHKQNEIIAVSLIDAGADVNLADDNSKTPLIHAVEDNKNYFCFPFVETDRNRREDLIGTIAKNFERFLCTCFGLVKEIFSKDSWTFSVKDDLKRNEKSMLDGFIGISENDDYTKSKVVEAYENVWLHCQEWKNVLIKALQNDKRLVQKFVGADVILSECDIKTAITCIARQEYAMMVQASEADDTDLRLSIENTTQGVGSDETGRQSRGVTWFEDFTTRITSSGRNPSLIPSLIKAGADLNKTDIDGKSALIHALHNNKKYLVDTLIKFGTDVNLFDKTGRTALMYAVKNNEDKDVVETLINAGAELNYTDNKGKTALFYAILNDNYCLAQVLVGTGADVNITDSSLKSALVYAVEDEKDWLATTLIKCGADVNLTDKRCKTPLIYAVSNETTSLARALIDADTDVNATDNDYKTALVHAVQSGNKRMAKFLISKGTDVNITDNEWKTALIHAVKNNEKSDLIHALIEAGTDINITDIEGKTALIYAVQNENVALTTALIDAGIDVNITDNDETTALMYCIQNENVNLASKLTQAGTEINLIDCKAKTALIYATEHQLEDVTVELIKAGADVNIADDEGKTALFYAVKSEFLVNALIEAGADGSVSDIDFRTPLFYAGENAYVVKLLVTEGKCSVTSKDSYGRTPLFQALTLSLESAEYLLAKGSNMNAKDSCGLSNLSFFVDNFLLGKTDKNYLVDGLTFFVENGVSYKTVFKTIINATFCKILSSNSVLSQVFDALTIARQYESNDAEAKDALIREILELIIQKTSDLNGTIYTWESQVPKILSFLIDLGANPNSVDSEGNTALHYATCLPFMGVDQKTVKEICSQLEDFGVLFNVKNQHSETPLLFCLKREVSEITIHKQKTMWPSLNGMAEVLSFLLENGSSVDNITAGETSFHLVLALFHHGLNYLDDKMEKSILDEAVNLFRLFDSAKIGKGITANQRGGANLNSPLHLWASLKLHKVQDYEKTIWTSITEIIDEVGGYCYYIKEKRNFKELLLFIFAHFLKSGVQLNDRNAKEETPLHLCRTWTAVKALLDAGANPNDVDVLGRPPLLAAAKSLKFDQSSTRFYPDVSIELKLFWITALDRGLDPWAVDKNGESVLSILVASEAFVLAKSLVEVASEKKYIQEDTIALSLLNAICKDVSTRTHWKSFLVEKILKLGKYPVPVKSKQDTPLHYCFRNIVRKPKESSVHWTIAKLLLSYGADCAIPNEAGETCSHIANSHPKLGRIFKESMDYERPPLLIPWLSVSTRYRDILDKAARGRDCERVEQIWYHKTHLASGSFGLVFAGINKKDGREVAIKRIEKLRMQQAEDKREIKSLLALAACEQVVRYLSFSEDRYFCYVVLELMEGDLNEYLDSDSTSSKQDTVKVCKDVVKGLRYLHKKEILHRDLKPSNILYRRHPKLCLKIADFGLSRRVDGTGSTTVYRSNVGTRCWIAPEVLKSAATHSKSSDIFACGLVLHYIFSPKKHPFEPAECEHKSSAEIDIQTEANLMNNNMEGWDVEALSSEADHLIKQLLRSDERERPTTEDASTHPLFWSKKKRIDFLIAVANQPEVAESRRPLTGFKKDLQTNFVTIVKRGKWNDPGYVHVPAIYTEMMKKRRTPYDTESVVELVRFIRNTYAHVSEDKRPTLIRKQVLEDFVFLEYFPNLVMEVYKAVTTHGWDQTREEIKCAMNE